ncbi:MAG: VWA domain-containing protein [Lachnospiraceae bacterium]|nr:VWA domain-containing protein [Lachnospiraceae bacterium]
MIKHHYEKASRRALNIIWNAAGRYDFDPCFMAFHSNGQADDYFNTIIGLTDKWLDLTEIAAFFSSYAAHPKAEEFDEFLWLGIENFVYERELPERPVLKNMRKLRGEEFFLVQQTLSEQQMAMQSMPVYRQQQTRWAEVTGRRLPLLNTKEKHMAEALCFSAEKTSGPAGSSKSADTVQVLRAMRAFLQEYFRYDPVADPRIKKELRGWKAWYSRLVSQDYRQKDILLIRTGSGVGDPANAVAVRWEGRRAPQHSDRQDAENRAYIESLFGPCRFKEAELHQAESMLCTGNDTGCRLWFVKATEKQTGKGRSGMVAAGSTPENRSHHPDPEIADTLQRMQIQYKNNRRFLQEHRMMINESIKKLSSELEVLLSSFSRGLPENGRTGHLVPEKAYRISLLHDPLVFVREGDVREMHLRVDILLDASQSRMNSQERIASEGYMIARSLLQNHVPVSVTAFRSLRGFTVLEELKGPGDTDCDGILHYYAGGWNRDGLALKAMHYLYNEKDRQPADVLRLLLILTDASPNDTVAGSSFGKNYEGAAAVEDAAAAVRSLRADGVRTAAVFHGSASHLENVYRIYGKEYIRVFSLQQFSGSVADLLQMVLRESGS